MVKIAEKGLVYKTSRLCYIHNYILVLLVLVMLFLFVTSVNFSFSIWWHFVGFFGLLMLAAGLSEEPEWERVFRKYIVTNNEVIKLDGLIRKKRIVLPYQSVSDVNVKKGVLGRIFNFGDVDVSGYKNDITMKGVRNPEEIQKIIQAKISIFREGFIKKGKEE